MAKRIKIMLSLLVLLTFVYSNAEEPEDAYIIINSINNPSPGYMFLGDGELSNSIFNHYGSIIDSAQLHSLPANIDFRYQSNGIITFCAYYTKRFYSLNDKYKIVDSFYVTNGFETDTHEFLLNPDGSYYLLALEYIPVDMSKIVANGKPNAKVENQIIQKYNAQKQLIWSWSCYENLPITDCVDDTTEFDLTQTIVDPYHINSLDVDSDGNLLVSIRNLNEVIKINTTTNKIEWRMGGSKSKNNQFVFTNDDIDGFTGFSNTHNAKWLKNGNLLLFDNGNTRPNKFSRAVEYKVNQSTKVVEKVWEFSPNPKIYAPIMSGAQRLDNGNTFITFGNIIFEVDKYGNIVLRAAKKSGLVYRGYKYNHKIFSVQKNISSPSIVDFNETNNNTSATINFLNVETPGYFSVTRYPYKPIRYTFVDLEPSKIIDQRWVIENNFNYFGKMSINLNSFSDYQIGDSIVAYMRNDENKGSFEKLESTFNKLSGIITFDVAKKGEIILTTFDQVGNTTLKMVSPRNGDVVSNKVQFTWYKVPSAQKYEFQLSQKDDFSNLLVNELSLTSNSFSVSNLENGKSYYFRARAKVGNITSKWSEVWKINIQLATPIQLIPVNNSKQIILNSKLYWSKVFSSKEYQVQLTKDTTASNYIFDKIVADTSITLENLVNSNIYYWRVRSSNGDIKSNWSSFKSFKTELLVPYIIQPVDNSVVTASFNLDFIRSAGIEYYQAFISQDTNFIKGFFQLLSAKQQTATLNLENNQKYFIKLRSISIDDTSRWSYPIAVTTVLPKPKILFPINGDVVTTNDVVFAFQSVRNATSYEVNLVSESILDNKKLFDTLIISNSTSFTLKNLADKTKNNWRVRAVNNLGKSDWTSNSMFIKETQIDLQMPILIKPENEAINTSINGILSWKQNSVLGVSYKIIMSETNTFDSLLIDEISVNNYIYYSNLKFGTKYYWKVLSFKNDSYSRWSEIRSFTTKPIDIFSSPILFLPLNNDTIDAKRGQFVWEKLENADKYHLQIAVDDNFINLVSDNSEISTNSYIESNLDFGTKFYWKVRAKQKDSLYFGSWSSISEFFTHNTTGINEEEIDNNTSIDLGIEYNVFDCLGRKVVLENKIYSNLNEIRKSLKKDIYFLVPYKFESKKKVMKFVVY